jgi:hypothetical protein
LLRLPDKLANWAAVVVVMAQFSREAARTIVLGRGVTMCRRVAVPVCMVVASIALMRGFCSRDLRPMAVLEQQMQALSSGGERAEGSDQHTGGQAMGECAHKNGNGGVFDDSQQATDQSLCTPISPLLRQKSRRRERILQDPWVWLARAQFALRIAINENG